MTQAKKFIVNKEKTKGRTGTAFVVRNGWKRDNTFLAAFAFRYDAELFATMLGCDTGQEDVAFHTRLKRDERGEWHSNL